MNSLIGTQAFGMRIPFVKEGDNLLESIANNYGEFGPHNGDIIGVTESVVARTSGMYVDLEEIGKWITDFKPSATILILYHPIFSRNRFVPILRGMLCAKNIKDVIIVSDNVDEVGNKIKHQITGVNYKDCYREWIEGAGKNFEWVPTTPPTSSMTDEILMIDCRLHEYSSYTIGLKDIFKERNSWGLLGMNAAGNNRLKLFPDKTYSEYFVNTLQQTIKERFNKDVEVMIYGDGAYKDPMSGIWEWADPVVSPAWTAGLDGFPTEMKLKNAIDSGMTDQDISESISNNRKNAGQQLGTTPRRIVDLLGSLMDLVSGSGDKGTPVVIVRDYFKKYID